jgi:hypothetical protein
VTTDGRPAKAARPEFSVAPSARPGIVPTRNRRIRVIVRGVPIVAAALLIAGVLLHVEGNSGESAPSSPPFLVGLNMTTPRADLAVVNAVTGRVIARVRPPAGQSFRDTAATAGSRTFMVAAEPDRGGCDTRLYVVKLNSQGDEAALTPFGIPTVKGEILASNDLSVSANGQQVAYSAELCNGRRTGIIGFANGVTHKVRAWQMNAESAWSISLAPNAQVIGFINSVIYGGDGTVRTLGTGLATDSLASTAHVMLRSGYGVDVTGSIAMSPEKDVMFACWEGPHSAGVGAYDTTSGKLLSVIHIWPMVNVAPCEIAVPTSGNYMLVYNLTLAGTIYRINLLNGQQSILGTSATLYPAALSISW